MLSRSKQQAMKKIMLCGADKILKIINEIINDVMQVNK